MPIQQPDFGFKRYVELGRIALVERGAHKGKLVAIVNVIDHRRAIVDAPTKDGKVTVPRHVMNYNDMTLTSLVIPKFPRMAKTATLTKKWEAAKIDERWQETGWAKKLKAREIRSNLNDFERFQLMKARKQRRFIVNKSLASAKKIGTKA